MAQKKNPVALVVVAFIVNIFLQRFSLQKILSSIKECFVFYLNQKYTYTTLTSGRTSQLSVRTIFGLKLIWHWGLSMWQLYRLPAFNSVSWSRPRSNWMATKALIEREEAGDFNSIRRLRKKLNLDPPSVFLFV